MLSPRHLHLLATFVQVCREGSFTLAARKLATSKSIVSSQLRTLEEVLGARLLERTTRRFALTQTGQEVLAAAERVMGAADDVASIAETRRAVPSGVLRVAAPVYLGTLWVAPAMARLCSKYSELRTELVLNDAKTDSIAQQLDATVSVNVSHDAAVTSVQLGTDFEIIVAAPALAEKWSSASQPKDLASAPWVAHSCIPAGAQYQFRNQRGTQQRLAAPPASAVANTTDACRTLVSSGAGFAVLPLGPVQEELRAGRMLRVLPQWKGRVIRIHLVLASQKHPPARVTFFVEELRAVLEESGRFPVRDPSK
jgi:DNA-binding transcriptional LysR family regulator